MNNPKLIKEVKKKKEHHFITQPNLEIIASPFLDFGIFLELCKFTTIKSVDVATIFTFSKDSVRKGIDSGFTAGEIEDFLKKHSKNELPQLYLEVINECREKYGNIIIGKGGIYLITSNELIMKELKAQKELERYFYKSLSPNVEILNIFDKDIDKLVKILRGKGYMPEMEESEILVNEKQNINFSLKPDEFFILRDTIKIILKLLYEYKLSSDYLNELRSLDDTFWKIESEYGEPSTSSFFREFLEELKNFLNKYKKDKLTDEKKLPEKKEATEKKEIKELIDYAINNRICIIIDYVSKKGEITHRKIEPEKIEYMKVYAYCHLRGEDRIFKLNNIKYAYLTEEFF